jgi:two-component system, cell cycle response regulator DivK
MARILIVDDEERNRKLAATVLAEADHEVVTASSGAEGVAAALAQKIDLVLMDLQMPGMDGVSALHKLRADPRTASLKVIAVTGQAAPDDGERLLAEGFDAYLSKPIRYKDLMSSVKRLLGEGTQN